MPCLTILCHPNPCRVGERAFLPALMAGAEVQVSRLEPVFAQPGEAVGDPLADRFLSRRPMCLAPAAPGLRITRDAAGSATFIDGEPLASSRDVTPDDLRRGVVLELADRVVLLLHEASPTETHGHELGMVGESDAMVRLRAEVRRVADLTVPVLLLGESGTGKELVARALHESSLRRDRPYLCVNMAAVSASMAASELFGHAKGAFTGAARDHTGYFTRASGGTLFMDEVGETPAEVQPMLLRALETGEIQPVGATGLRTVSVRVVSATDLDLVRAVGEGRFRLPLFHRLAGYEIVVPPLRERRDDIGRLLIHFLRDELGAIGEENVLSPTRADGEPWLCAKIVARLARHPWPGNVRQLRNVVRQIVIASRGADVMSVRAGVERLLEEVTVVAAAANQGEPASHVAASLASAGGFGEERVTEALRRNSFRVGATAAELGISRTWLYTLIERLPGLRKARDLTRDEILTCQDECQGDLDAMSQRLQVSRHGLSLRMKELGLS